jgi:hypothetical protein
MEAIIGYAVALVLSLMGVVGFETWAKVGVTNVLTAATSSQLLTFDKAAAQYVQDNGAAIAAIATATTPVTVTGAMLVSANYLPTGFAAQNPFRQTWQVQVTQPTPGVLQTMVFSVGGQAITDPKQLVQIAAQAGAQGGFVPYPNQGGDATLNATTAYGAYGMWKVPLANYTNPGSGHIASLLAFTNTDSNNAYLYRLAVPGHPELNDMQTDLGLTDVGGTAHNINGANVISTQSLNALASGSISVPSVTMANGSVVAFSQVAEGGVLGLVGSNGQRVYVQNINGSFQLTNGQFSGPLLTVDQSGNVVANGTVEAGGRVTGDEYLALKGTATIGAACTSGGSSLQAASSDGSGSPLFCQSGVWSTDKPNLYRYVFTGSTTWTVPAGVKSALVSEAGGGTGGVSGFDYGPDQPTVMISGSSGGFALSYPVTLTPGATINIVVGSGGPPGGYPTGGPGGTSAFGNYLTCTGGDTVYGEAYSYPGTCYSQTGAPVGFGSVGQYVMNSGGYVSGGPSPLGYGTGGGVFRCNGCAGSNPTQGYYGQQGVVIVDVLY